MENTNLSKASVSFGLSLAVTSIINAIIVAVKEKSDAVMNGMKKVTGHHWTRRGLLVHRLRYGTVATQTIAKHEAL